MDRNGAGKKRLTDNDETFPSPGAPVNDRYPACKPGTSQAIVAFSRTGTAGSDIIELDTSTSTEPPYDEENLTGGSAFPTGGDEDGVTYSPGGTFIAFWHGPNHAGIYTYEYEGDETLPIRRSLDVTDEWPDWGELTTGVVTGCP